MNANRIESRWRIAAALVAVVMLLWLAAGQAAAPPAPAGKGRQPFKVDLEGVRRVELNRDDQGRYVYELTLWNGQVQSLDPQAFAQRVYDERAHRAWYQKLLNITSTAGVVWVAVGMAGQLLFTGRMLVQWFLSEKQKRSVVPPIFWWMSTFGGLMLLAYFLWRKDIVGVMGQATGSIVYVRNLMLIYSRKAKDQGDSEGEPRDSAR